MTEAITPTTELEAVNEMLRVIGESPVSSLGDDEEGTNSDVASAYGLLRSISRMVQAKGWNFNHEFNYPLTVDASDEIPVPANTIRVKVPKTYGFWVLRGLKLYDRENQVTTTTATGPFYVEILLFLPWTDLPESARRYIFTKAAKMFADAQLGDQYQHQYSAAAEAEALSTLKEEEGDTADYNILDNPQVGYAARRFGAASGGRWIS